MNITTDIVYIGVNDHKVDLFEGQYPVPQGMSYNSYLVKDEKTTIFDTVDVNFMHEWMDNIQKELGDASPDYLVIQHMEPDHSANISTFMMHYPKTTIVSSKKAFTMMKQFFGVEYEDRRIIVKEGSTLCTGKHTFAFVEAPMVHWPEVVVTYDTYDKVLFSADGFGKFGALDAKDQDGEWDSEARRYYIGIVGKYGAQVQALLKKAVKLEITKILPLHGPVLTENLGHYISLYDIWSSYAVESDGIVIAYTSVYGHTKEAVERFAEMCRERGCPKLKVMDLARCDMFEAIEYAFQYGKLVLATTTYNSEIFPFMRTFITHLTERNFQNRRVGFIENGSWAPTAARVMRNMFENSKAISYCDTTVTINSALTNASEAKLAALADEMCCEYIAARKDGMAKTDLNALFKIGYGLYVVTSNDGKKDNGLIVNTVSQVTNTPNRVAVTINKQNYSHHVIKETGKMNLNIISEEARFSTFQRFGFQSGRTANKFEGLEVHRSKNGLIFLSQEINSYISLKVEQYIDLDTHGMFICTIVDARILNREPTMTYDFYLANVKPKPATEGVKKGWVCKICGYVHEGENLPADFICPLCKHGAADFERIG